MPHSTWLPARHRRASRAALSPADPFATALLRAAREVAPAALLGLLGAASLLACGDGMPAPTRLEVLGSVEVVGASGADMAIDPVAGVVYVAGGMGQTGLVRVDVSDPARMTAAPFVAGFGGGIAVDPQTGRIASTDGFGGTLGIFESNGAPFDSEAIGGCGGALGGGAGRFAVTAQCGDVFAIYDPGPGGIIFQAAPPGVAAGNLTFHEPSGRFYFNRTPGPDGVTNQALVATPTLGGGFAAADLGVLGIVVGSNPRLDRIYLFDEQSQFGPTPALVALDGQTHAFVGSLGVTVAGNFAVDAAGGRLYQSGGDGIIRLLDAATGELLAALDLPAATGGFRGQSHPIATDGPRAYVLARGGPQGALRLFVIGAR